MPSFDGLSLLVATDSGNRFSKGLHWPGGWGELHCVGSFDSGTVTLKRTRHNRTAEELGDSGNYVGLENATALSAAGIKSFRAAECVLVLELSGSSGNDEIEASITAEAESTKRGIAYATAEAVEVVE